jgi:hypothetical protein
MKTLLLHIIIGLFAFSAFGQNVEEKLLKYSFKNNDVDSLDMFFTKWEKEFQPISQKQFENLSDTLKDVYEIFSDFYTPQDLRRIGGSEWGDSLYFGVDFMIVQNRIDFSIVETLDKKKIILTYLNNNVKDSSIYENYPETFLKDTTDYSLGFTYFSSIEYLHEDSIMDFRPIVNIDSIGVLFYKPEYTRTIARFLKNKHHKLGFGGIMNPARAKGKSKTRLDWINTKVKIFQGHWGGYWQMTTYPSVNQILIDKERETALVYFRMVYEGGEALYKKIDNKWALIESKLTWIE